MRAPLAQQRKLVTLTELDARLARLRVQDRHLPEQEHLDELRRREQRARESVARARIRLEDIARQRGKIAAEVRALQQRVARVEEAATPDNTAASRDLNHERKAVARLLTAAQTKLHEIDERERALQTDVDHEGAQLDALAGELAQADEARLRAIGDLEANLAATARERAEIAAQVSTELLSIFNSVAAERGVGAGELRGGTCGACRMQLDKTTLAWLLSRPADEVLRCPECTAILVRPEGTR